MTKVHTRVIECSWPGVSKHPGRSVQTRNSRETVKNTVKWELRGMGLNTKDDGLFLENNRRWEEFRTECLATVDG